MMCISILLIFCILLNIKCQEVFRPMGDDWELIPKNASVPSGYHYKIDFNTSQTYIKPLRTSTNSNLLLISNENTTSTFRKEAHEQNLAYAKHLMKTLQKYITNDAEIIINLLDKYKNLTHMLSNVSHEELSINEVINQNHYSQPSKNRHKVFSLIEGKAQILDNLKDIVDQVDNAQIFADSGALTWILNDIYFTFLENNENIYNEELNQFNSSVNMVILKKGLDLVGTAVQNNPKVQNMSYNTGILNQTISILSYIGSSQSFRNIFERLLPNDQDKFYELTNDDLASFLSLSKSLLFALSTQLRNFPIGQITFFNGGHFDGSQLLHIFTQRVINDISPLLTKSKEEIMIPTNASQTRTYNHIRLLLLLYTKIIGFWYDMMNENINYWIYPQDLPDVNMELYHELNLNQSFINNGWCGDLLQLLYQTQNIINKTHINFHNNYVYNAFIESYVKIVPYIIPICLDYDNSQFKTEFENQFSTKNFVQILLSLLEQQDQFMRQIATPSWYTSIVTTKLHDLIDKIYSLYNLNNNYIK